MADRDRTYRCLNPTGIQVPVKTFPLAPRLESVEGKEIWFSICGEPDITIALERKFKSDFPGVNWRVKKTYGVAPIPLSEEELKTCDGLILGVAW